MKCDRWSPIKFLWLWLGVQNGIFHFRTKIEVIKINAKITSWGIQTYAYRIQSIFSISSYEQNWELDLNSPWSNSTDTITCIHWFYFTHNFYFSMKKFRLACESFQLFWAWFCWTKSTVLPDINDIDQCLLIPKQVTTWKKKNLHTYSKLVGFSN